MIVQKIGQYRYINMASLLEPKVTNVEFPDDGEDDDTEFLDSIVAQNLPEDQAAEDKEYLEFKRFRSQVKTAEERGISRKQILPFRALTELDEGRKDRIGIKPLFILFCESGNRTWLNPGKGIGVLEATLRKFSGDRKILIPLIELLIQITEAKLSPAAFLKFIILPRLRGDMNWRNWEKAHFPAFQIIKNILTEVISATQFQTEIIQNGQLTLARDIILPKYVGGPIAKLDLSKFSNAHFQSQYAKHWKGLQFANYLAFFFIKRNVLPLLSELSGKLEANQILSLVSELVPLENEFTIAYPDEIYSWKKLPNFSLYPVSFHHSYRKRVDAGYSLFQIYSELLGFTKAIRTTLPTRAGIHLAELIVKKMLKKQSPSFILQLHRLIEALPDSGGLRTYGWHIDCFVNLSQPDRDEFLRQVEANGGLHPRFPRPFWMRFQRDGDPNLEMSGYYESIGLENLKDLITNISSHLQMSEFLNQKVQKTPLVNHFLTAFCEKFPEKQPWIRGYQEDILEGRDRAWTSKDIQFIDAIHPEFQKLLLMSVIRGIGANFSRFKSTTLNELYTSYASANELPTLPYEIGFEWEDTTKENKVPKDEELIRRSLNLQLFEDLISALGIENGNTSQVISILGIEHLHLKNSITEKRDRLINTDDEVQKEKTQKAIPHLEKQIKQLEEIQMKFPTWTLEKQIVFIIFFASKNADRLDNLFPLTVSLLLNSKVINEEILIGKDELLADIIVENLQMYQIDSLILFCKNLTQSLQANEKIISLFEAKDAEFIDILAPYSSLKKQSIEVAALDAALNRLLRVGKMESEKAKWLDKIIKATEAPKMRKYKIYTSKSFIDSYYGDMGGICLASRPKEILRPNLFNYRIADETSGKIVGMFLLTYSTQRIESLGINEFFSAFAINPLYSVLYHWSKKKNYSFISGFAAYSNSSPSLLVNPCFSPAEALLAYCLKDSSILS
jgi:hypothetical protein